VEVAGGERGQVIGPSRELTGFVGVGEELCIALWITESLAKLCVIARNEVFRILMCVGWRGGGCLAAFFSFPGGGEGACRGLGLWRGSVR